PGRMLLRAFRHKRIPVSGILKDKDHATTTKTRILAGMPHTWRQQVVRIDREPESELSVHMARELALATREYLRASDALLGSDYGYGAANPQILNAARDRRRTPRPAASSKSAGNYNSIPVILDSRHRMLEFFGITGATPNEPELEEA